MDGIHLFQQLLFGVGVLGHKEQLEVVQPQLVKFVLVVVRWIGGFDQAQVPAKNYLHELCCHKE